MFLPLSIYHNEAAIMQMMEKSKLKNTNKLSFISYIENKRMATKKERTLGNKTTPIPRIIADLSLLFLIDEVIAIPIFNVPCGFTR
jgi:hypothetical protein